ncbi:hypothetical protein [Rhodoferax sp. GW822-FHT02A01]|uniref:hypothetical protein n=1 Tax=Rhodoferax sp. GW822-FHT02A01 TaxID=3141537 RepID=UPI00315C4D35
MTFTRFWDWIDSREIDKHVLSAGVFWGTVKITEWAMAFAAAHPEKSGIDVGAVIAAVTAPYSLLQAACVKFYFDNRNPPPIKEPPP